MANIIQLFPSDVLDSIGLGQIITGDKMDAKKFAEHIIRPALQVTGLWSKSAENLLLGTALAESSLDVVKQIGGGPALSFYQVEPATYHDIVLYLSKPRNEKLEARVLSACFVDILPYAECLTWNIRLATLIARLVYFRSPDLLPMHNDVEGHAKYWKRLYNTEIGAGTEEHFIRQWKRFDVS